MEGNVLLPLFICCCLLAVSALCLPWSHEGCLSFCTSMCPCGPDSVGCSAWVQEDLSGQMCPPSLLPNVSPDCTSQGPWRWTIGFILLTISDESQDGSCGLFPQLRKRKKVRVKRRHKKLSVTQVALASYLWPWPKAIVQGRVREHNLCNTF